MGGKEGTLVLKQLNICWEFKEVANVEQRIAFG
jgi:hypothetical protein